MGFDLYGKNKTEKGEYFRNNVWWWRPLARYVLAVCDDIIVLDEKTYWQSNDGQKVLSKTALAIAERLDKLVESGTVRRYAEVYEQELSAMPDEPCWLCKGTGYRDDDLGKQMRLNNPSFTCNCCRGTGKIRPSDTQYSFSEDNVKEFAEFCRESGGFEIW